MFDAVATAEPADAPEIRPAGDELTVKLSALRRGDAAVAGGKGANLGEALAAGLPVPDGFVITVAAFRAFLADSGIASRIEKLVDQLNVDDPDALQSTTAAIRELVLRTPVPDNVRAAVTTEYSGLQQSDHQPAFVAVRSSAAVEDSAKRSFAGMFASFLNVQGEAILLSRVRECWASAFSAQVLCYRAGHHLPGGALVAVLVQRMVDSEKAGVLFTADPATSDASTAVIEAAFGLGEVVVAGQVTPDRYEVDKRTGRLRMSQIGNKAFLLKRGRSGGNERVYLCEDAAGEAVLDVEEIASLARLANWLESHYGVPQDAEWAIESGLIYLVQTRPITTLGSPIAESERARVLARGLAASAGRASGIVRVITSVAAVTQLPPGEILVTGTTTPDWMPVMRRAAAVITDTGGMTSHAAIVSRELGIPCVVGTRDATRVLHSGMHVSVDAARGLVFEGDCHA